MAEDPDLVKLTVIMASPGKGKGLFARQNLSRGTVVARMREPSRMKRSQVEDYLLSNPALPEDCVVYASRSPLVFYDESWDGEGRIPRWYRLNHSKRPNTAPCIVDPSVKPRDQEIAWVTTRKVAALEELTFRYENAPDDWD